MSAMKEIHQLIEDCYRVLGNPRNQWGSRNTNAGQNLLNRLKSSLPTEILEECEDDWKDNWDI